MAAFAYDSQMLDWTTAYLSDPSAPPPPPHPKLLDSQWMNAYAKSPQGLSISGQGCKRLDVEPPKSACVVYVGLSYMPKRVATDENAPAYDLDYETCGAYENHGVMIRESLDKMDIQNVTHYMATNQSARHSLFCDLVGADPASIECVSKEDEDGWIKLWAAGAGGAGNGLPAGHRLKKVVDNNPLPDADVYVFVRCDITLKKPLHEMNIDMTKINYGWIEQRGPSLAMGDHYSGFKTAGRVSGSGLHVVPRRLVSLFVEAYSRDHNSLHWLLKVKKLSLLSDVNFIEGIDRAWSSSSDIMDNPMYVIYRGEDWPSPNVKVRVAGVVAHIADHAARGADLTKPPYSLLVEALAVAQGEVKDS